MNTLIKESQVIESKSQLSDFFRSGFKNTQKLGVEFEKIPVRSDDYKAVEFFYKNGMLDFLYEYKSQIGVIPYFENDIMLGLSNSIGTLTLEPGCQIEISLKPLESLIDIKRELDNYNKISAQLGDKLGISFLALGCQPVSTFENIRIIPKGRYSFMTKFFADKGTLPYAMMRETAGIQTNIDYKDETDAIRKLSVALKLSPFLSAFFVNSPIRGGKLSEYKSFRLNAWLNTDNKRCGLISKKLIETPENFTFADYAEILLDVPMIFSSNEYVGNKTFRDLFIKNRLTMSDWKNHLSLFFPDVRLKNYIEIRNHDCQKIELAIAVPAIYKGIFYSDNGIDDVNELLKDFSYYDFEFVRQNAPRFGMDFSIKNIKISDIVKCIFEIARQGLKKNMQNEDVYLDAANALLDDNLTPADIIIRNFEGAWNKSIKKIVKFSKIN